MFDKVIKIYNDKWRCWWSNYKWRKMACEDLSIPPELITTENTKEELNRVANLLSSKFQYKYDGIADLFDSMRPPQSILREYISNDLFLDDCDGFHALLCYVLEQNDFESRMICIIPSKFWNGHCVAVVKINNLYYVQDYGTTWEGKDSMEEAVNTYVAAYNNENRYGHIVSINMLEYESFKWSCKEIQEF